MKLIHSVTPYFYERFLPAGYRLDIIPFSTPTDGKDAAVTGSVDYGTFGIAAAILGAVAHQPVVVYGSECDKGMAVIARKDAQIATMRDLKGKRVGILPGTTQQVFFYAAAHARHERKRHSPGADRLRRYAGRPGAWRHRCLCRRRAGAEPVACQRHRQARRIPVFNADGQSRYARSRRKS